MSTNKYYKKYASGGSFKNRQLNDGLRAMQQQTQIEIGGLETQAEQVRQQRNEHMKSLDRKASKEADNRAELYKLEVELPYKLRGAALDRNHQTQIKSLQQEAQMYKDRAKMWAQLTPTLSKTFAQLATDVETYINTKNAIKEFKIMDAEGSIGRMEQVYSKVIHESDTIGIANTRFKEIDDVAKTGSVDAKQRFDYLTNLNETRNPVLQDMIYQKIKEDFAGIEQEFLGYLQENGVEVSKNNALALYQFRAAEILRQYGISPNSKLGFKMFRLFSARGQTQEDQITLADDNEKYGKAVANGLKRIKTLTEPISPTDFPNTYQYEFAVRTQEEQKNAAWIDVVASLNAMPVQTKNGYIRPLTVNTRDNIVNWAKGNVGEYQFVDDFLSEMFGVTENNPLGYLIPGAPRNSKKKTDRIFGKFPFLREEMTAVFYDEYDKVDKERTRLNENRQRETASRYQQKLDSGYYKQNPDEFWHDWESTNGNPFARNVFANSLGYKGENINEDTLTSTIVQQYKAGNLSEMYSAWAGLTDTKQEIGFIVKDLQELAANKGLTVTEGQNSLDQYLKNYTSGQVDLVTSKDAITKTAHPSTEGIANEALGFLLEHFRTNNVGSVEERFELAKAALDAKLGIVNGVPVPFDNNDLRGAGEFLQKRGKSGSTNQVIFVKKAGENFGNITSLEIDISLEDSNNRNRLEKLKRLVTDDLTSDNPSVSDQDIADLLRDGTTSNRLLNHLMKPTNLKNVTQTDFINSIKQTVDNTLIRQWGGEDWCNHILGAYSGTLTNDQKAIGVCAKAIEHEFDTPAWEFLINPSLRDRLQKR